VGNEPQHLAGTVVDPGEDLDLGAIRELEVSEVRPVYLSQPAGVAALIEQAATS
jgi:hypothetical protein